MIRNPRYAAWLDVADDLDALHEFAFDEHGPFAHWKDRQFALNKSEAVRLLRHKCATGRWYWWDKTTIAGIARAPLHSFQHVISDSGGLYEETESGRELIARIERIKERIRKIEGN